MENNPMVKLLASFLLVTPNELAQQLGYDEIRIVDDTDGEYAFEGIIVSGKTCLTSLRSDGEVESTFEECKLLGIRPSEDEMCGMRKFRVSGSQWIETKTVRWEKGSTDKWERILLVQRNADLRQAVLAAKMA